MIAKFNPFKFSFMSLYIFNLVDKFGKAQKPKIVIFIAKSVYKNQRTVFEYVNNLFNPVYI